LGRRWLVLLCEPEAEKSSKTADERIRKESMAIVLIEEVLMGLGEAKIALEQAVTILNDIVEDMPPDMGGNLQTVLDTSLLQPLQSRLAALDKLLHDMAASN
jgi:hypothetical protein